MNKEIRIPFKGWDLVTWVNEKDKEALVAIKPIAEAIGVRWQPQHRKLTTNPKFNCHHMMTVGHNGSAREMLCLPVKQLNGWLYGINASRVKESIRPKLLQFQEECHAAIYHHMHGDANQEVVEILKEMIKQQQIVIDEMANTIKDLQQQTAMHTRMLGMETSAAARRLAAAKNFKVAWSK